MIAWICKNLKMVKGKDKDTLNLTFIFQVYNYFVVGNFLSDLEKASAQ